MNKLIFLLPLLFSCGFKVKGLDEIKADVQTDLPEKIALEPNFEEAAAFCDQRYLPDKESAEACFLDFRNYYSLEISLDLQGLEDYCSENYSSPEDIEQCEDDLLGLFSGLGNIGE